MDVEQTEQKSRGKVLVVAVIVVVFMAVIGVVVYALMISGNEQERASTTTTTQAPWPRVATKEEISKNLTELNEGLKQAKDDQTAATAALKDNEKQIKVGN